MSTVILEVRQIDKNDDGERMIKRYLKKFKKLKLMDEIREHDYYEKPSEKRREKERNKKYKIEKVREEQEEKNN
jgi:ribosomal protein S21